MICRLEVMDDYPSMRQYESTISELFEVLRVVENLRADERELEQMRRSFTPQDGERMAELNDNIKHYRKELDEWFKTLREEEQ